jgi:UDP-glucose 4-epimerase
VRTVVTGGAGFIGSHLVDRLLRDGHSVTVIDNLVTGKEANLAPALANPDVRFVRGSVLDADLVAGCLDSAELVFHLAAAVGVHHVVQDPVWTVVTNTNGTETVLGLAAERGCRVVFASSSEIYGTSADVPYSEDGPRVLGPTWIHRWSYSTSKAVDEHLCFGYAERGLPMSIVRYFNIYGPRMDPAGYGSVIARFVTQAASGEPLTVHGDGEQSRCFTYVTEAVDATVRAGTRAEALGQAFNVGSTTETTVNQLAEAVIRATGSPSTVRHVSYEHAFGPNFSDARRRVPDVSKAGRLLDWEARIPLDVGLELTLRQHQATP